MALVTVTGPSRVRVSQPKMSIPDASDAAQPSQASESPAASEGPVHVLDSLFSHITTPGSTYVSPTFLFLVDLTLFFLLFLFISLLVMTRSLHFLALGGITLGLWGSVKLYVFSWATRLLTHCYWIHFSSSCHFSCIHW